MRIKIKNESLFENPVYATKGSSGLDLKADFSRPIFFYDRNNKKQIKNQTNKITLEPGERVLIPTGIFLGMPKGVEAQIRPRSGFALKQGITVLNTPGTIDSDYRGEIKVILINCSGVPVSIKHGQKIAQLVFSKVKKIKWKNVFEFRKTGRGLKGFGSTGK